MIHSPDLPVKLWLKILAYLPQATLHKMVGVNRSLFELAMDDRYGEIRFVSDDIKTLRIFEQMRSPIVARRVRRFVIQPAFLPDLDEEAPVVAERKHHSRHRLLNFLHLKTPSTSALDDSPDDLETARNTLFREVIYAMTLCKNLQELEIIIHDLSLTPSFTFFLDSLWKDDSVGPNLRNIAINTTLTKVPALLEPLVKSAKSLASLEGFSIDISPSRIDLTEAQHNLAEVSLRSFSHAFGGNLTAIALSSPFMNEIATFLEAPARAGCFPKLKKLEIFSIFTNNPGAIEAFSRCIANHADSLEHLTVHPQPRQAGRGTPNTLYNNWINPTGHTGSTAFAGVVLSSLRTLDISLCEISQGHARWPTVDTLTSKLLPDLSTFAPNITSLILSDASFSFRRISDLVMGLSHNFGGSNLETLIVNVTTLSPQLFDMFAFRLPRVTTLRVDYHSLSDSEQSYNMGNCQLNHIQLDRFCEGMRTRRYPQWELKSLRLTTIDFHCGAAHPNPLVMKKVAESLPYGVELDCSYVCFCETAFNVS